MFAFRLLVQLLLVFGENPELECLNTLHRRGAFFQNFFKSNLQKDQLPSRETAAEEFAADCQLPVASATLQVHFLRKEAYLHRINTELRARGQGLSGNLSARLRLCLPHSCTLDNRLLRLAVHYTVLVHALKVAPPLPQALQPSELRWRILIVHGVPAFSNSSKWEFGQCLCSQDLGDRPAAFAAKEIRSLMQDLHRPGLLRQEALKKIDERNLAKFSSAPLPSQLIQSLPSTDKCYDWHSGHDRVSCAAALLSHSLLHAAAAKTPVDLIARLDDALRAALVMRDCPWPLLDAFACDGCYGPPTGFRINALLEKTRAAHAGFAQGARVLKDPLVWTSQSDTASCEPGKVDAQYEALVASTPARYLAALPHDSPSMRRTANTFGRHCDWTKFFAAPSRDQEARANWRISVRRQDFEIVNLASFFADAQTDRGWMQTRTSQEVFKTRLWSGNTIQKSLLTAVYTARHLLVEADVFCLLELDSAFVADNLRAFARAHSLSAEEAAYVAALHYGMKPWKGIFPHTAGGLCVTREGLRRLAQFLEKQKMDAVRYEIPERVGLWAPTILHPPETARRVNGCGFVAGHWWDIMLGRCFTASNVTAHPAVADALGRQYFTNVPLPCTEHLVGSMAHMRQTLPATGIGAPRLERLANAFCHVYGFAPELHRYAVCEPHEVASVADYWLSPYTIGYHGYKNLSLMLHAYRILYGSATCDWKISFRPKVLLQGEALRQRVAKVPKARRFN